ncbi:hypothetical protein ABIF65_011859, partial [Bradyrhizobium japonicum]
HKAFVFYTLIRTAAEMRNRQRRRCTAPILWMKLRFVQ